MANHGWALTGRRASRAVLVRSHIQAPSVYMFGAGRHKGKVLRNQAGSPVAIFSFREHGGLSKRTIPFQLVRPAQCASVSTPRNSSENNLIQINSLSSWLAQSQKKKKKIQLAQSKKNKTSWHGQYLCGSSIWIAASIAPVHGQGNINFIPIYMRLPILYSLTPCTSCYVTVRY